MLSPAPASYIDGVKALHGKLNKFFVDAKRIASMVIPLSELDKQRYNVDHSFRIYVDSSQCGTATDIKGYYIYGKYICRFLPVTIEPAALFPVRDLSGWDDKDNRKGLTAADILGIPLGDEILCFRYISNSRVSYPLFDITEMEPSFVQECEAYKTLDDIGVPYFDFSDINSLKVIENIPSHFLESTYSLVGIKYYAPFTKSSQECFCVLFAELNNPHDTNAIKVLRWFPYNRDEAIVHSTEIQKAEVALSRVQRQIVKMTDLMLEWSGHIDNYDVGLINAKSRESKYKKILSEKKYLGDTFFELGYIAKEQNTTLHKFMVENDSRLLFGKVINNSITIMGGVSMFRNYDYKLPSCLTGLNIY